MRVGWRLGLDVRDGCGADKPVSGKRERKLTGSVAQVKNFAKRSDAMTVYWLDRYFSKGKASKPSKAARRLSNSMDLSDSTTCRMAPINPLITVGVSRRS